MPHVPPGPWIRLKLKCGSASGLGDPCHEICPADRAPFSSKDSPEPIAQNLVPARSRPAGITILVVRDDMAGGHYRQHNVKTGARQQS